MGPYAKEHKWWVQVLMLAPYTKSVYARPLGTMSAIPSRVRVRLARRAGVRFTACIRRGKTATARSRERRGERAPARALPACGNTAAARSLATGPGSMSLGMVRANRGAAAPTGS